jgi:hypothetical protein
MGNHYRVEVGEASFPQIGPDHIFSEVELRAAGANGPPASTRTVFPVGVITRVDSPSPASIAVTSVTPGCGDGATNARASDATKTAASPAPVTDIFWRAVHIASTTEATAAQS